MGVSPLADLRLDIHNDGRFNVRESRLSGFTIHHNAGVDAYGEATRPGREVSAQYWIDNAGNIRPQIDEDYRAWTSGETPEGRAADHRNVTVEVSNSPEGVREGTWAISAAAERALSNLIGDVFRRHNLGPVKRGKYGGVAIHRDFVQTECPGGYIVANLKRIIENAEKARRNPEALESGAEQEVNVPPKRKRKNMIGLTIADGENRYKLGKNKRLYATFDGRCFVSLTKDDADAVSVNMGEAFANVSYGGWEAYRDAAEVLK